MPALMASDITRIFAVACLPGSGWNLRFFAVLLPELSLPLIATTASLP